MQLFTGTGDSAMDVLAFPGSDISGVNSSPPLVDCGQHPQLGGRVYLAVNHVIDAVHLLGPVLSVSQREQIATNVGAIVEADAVELHDRIAWLEGEVERLNANLTVPLADVLAHLRAERVEPPAVDVALEVPAVEAVPVVEPEPETSEFPKAEGGGWYLLSNGEKVQGHANAETAQAKLGE